MQERTSKRSYQTTNTLTHTQTELQELAEAEARDRIESFVG